MSAIEWVYQNSKHTGNVYQVLRTLAEAYNTKGACLSMKEIAHRTKVSQPTARRALEKLQADKTITIDRNGGEKRGTGITNCYRIPGFDTPLTHSDTPLSDDVTPGITQVTPPDLIPLLSSGVTPTVKSEPHTGAAGANKEPEKEQKEFVVLQQTNSLNPKDTRAQDIAPMTEGDLERDLNATSPEAKAAYEFALSKGNPPEGKYQDNHEPPGSGQPPLPQSVLDIYQERWNRSPEGKEPGVLSELIGVHGVSGVVSLLRDCDLLDNYNTAIQNPAAWIFKTGGGKKPGRKTALVTRSHSQTPDVEPVYEYPPGMKFEPPPGAVRLKGAASWVK